jgi:hypothetical protein
MPVLASIAERAEGAWNLWLPIRSPLVRVNATKGFRHRPDT